MKPFIKRAVFFGLIVVLVISFSVAASGQESDPVRWSFSAKKKAANSYELILTAELGRPWRIYSQNTGKGGPIPTKITFKPNRLVTPTGKVSEVGTLVKEFDRNFNTNVLYYFDKVQFIATVRVTGTAKAHVTGSVEYMVTDNSQALPPTRRSFDISLP